MKGLDLSGGFAFPGELTMTNHDCRGMTYHQWLMGQILPVVYANAVSLGLTEQVEIIAEADELATSVVDMYRDTEEGDE